VNRHVSSPGPKWLAGRTWQDKGNPGRVSLEFSGWRQTRATRA
jgi:hypothetical protein